MKYIAVIGLETHVQVLSKSKLFCGCKNIFGAPPNSEVCPVCLGMPGVLPILNFEVVKKAIRLALLLNCTINKVSFFDRKNYFYPDIPKSYQITQYHKPIIQGGFIELSTGKKIRIRRIHIEEDVGKLLHPQVAKSQDESFNLGIIRADYSLIDMNRSGVPLFEIVTEPDIESAEQAYEYLLTLKRKLQFDGISHCDMEKGQLRCDVNISIRKIGGDIYGNRVEIKNLNSFKFIKEAISFEIARQIELLESGKEIESETRLWDPIKKITYALRSKEAVEDYRYFLEPDLPPLIISDNLIQKIKSECHENPIDLLDKYVQNNKITSKEKEILLSDEEMCLFFLEVAKRTNNPKACFNWIANELKGRASEKKVSVWELGITIHDMVNFIQKVSEGVIEKNYAKELLRQSIDEKKELNKLLKEMKPSSTQVNLEEVVDSILKENARLVEEYFQGKENVKNVFIGKVLSRVKGIYTPSQITECLNKRLKR